MISYNNSAPKAVNNVGQFGATEGSIGAYKSAAEYAADAKYWALLSQTKYSSVEEILAEVERLYVQGRLLEEDINQLKNDFEAQEQTLLGLIQSTGTAIDNANAATELSKEATQQVLAQLDIISNMTVQTTLLPPGSLATGSYDNATGVFSFGIPEGKPGRDGTDGTISDIGSVPVGTPVTDDYGFYVDKIDGGLYRAAISDIANLVPSVRSISINGGSEQMGTISFNSVSSFNTRTGDVVSQAGDYEVSQITGAAASGDNSDITSLSGLTTAISVSQGGTGATTSAGARSNLGLGLVSTESIVPITKGGTGSSSAENARLALVSAKSGDNYDITSLNNLTTALSIEQGGTGVDNQSALWNVVRPNGPTPLVSIPVADLDAATKKWTEDTANTIAAIVAEASTNALVAKFSDPDGATTYPDLQMARWRDEGDIRGWGAKCNGVADDTAAIQSAITEANGVMIKLKLPRKSVVKVMGTILVPGGVSIDLNNSTIEGNGSQSVVGTNTIFESAYWDAGELKSNWSVPDGSVGSIGLVPDMRIGGGRIRFAGSAYKMYHMIYGSGIKDTRITATPYPVIVKDSFYGTIEEISAMNPPAGIADTVAFQIESNIQAMGVRKCVASGFNTNWKITGLSSADCFDSCTSENGVRGMDIYGSASGNIQNLEIHNWYFEKNSIGIRVDPSATVERLYIRNSYLHWQMVHLEASTVLSGGIDKSCNIKDGADPSGTNWRGDFTVTGRSGEKTFIIEIEDHVSTIQNGNSIPSNYSVGKGVEIKRIETLTDSSGGVIARNLRQTSTAPKRYTGQTISTVLPSNSIPFCTVNTNDPERVTITTQVVRSPYNIVHINLLVIDNGTPINACGTLFGSFGLMQPAGAKPMTISYVENNMMTIAIAGTNITNVQGIIQVV